MKIKELHIRNIASIEKADIDFEKDLIDSTDQSLSTIFLISGDTGAGKTVLLDAISLALYKTTPRVVGVENKTNNEFADKDGRMVKVKSVEQYTRLGISVDDPCYSEVVFEGNDARIYRSRLTLGYYKSREKDAEGQSVIKYKAPVLEVEEGGKTLTRTDAEIAVQEAIGLTFDQFGRMAMLAQGQFASFLTGGKEEREKILEQLTNTSLFSDYGVAINNLFKKAKDDMAIVQTQHDTIAKGVKPEAELAEMELQKKAMGEEMQTLETQRSDIEKQLRQVEEIRKAETEARNAKEKLAQCEQERESDVFLDHSALVADWESTKEARQNLGALREANLKLKGIKDTQYPLLQTSFSALSADFVARKSQLETLTETVKQEREWLNLRIDSDTIFTQASTIDLQLKNCSETLEKIAKNQEEQKKEQDQTAGLVAESQKQEQEEQRAKQAVEEKQNQIDEVKKQRDLLEPQKIHDETIKAQQRENDLKNLQHNWTEYDKDALALTALQEEIVSENTGLDVLKTKSEEAEKAYQEAKSASDKATERYQTMKMSVEETLIKLRKKLYDQHSEVCPLCGQHIAELHVNDADFQVLVNPLEQEMSEAKDLLSQKESASQMAKDVFARADEALKTKRSLEKKQREQLEQKKQTYLKESLRLGLDINQPIPSQLVAGLSDVVAELQQLAKRESNVQSLQRQIDTLQEEKKPLDRALLSAQRASQKAKTAVEDSTQKQLQLKKDFDEEEQRLQEQKKEINDSIIAFYPSWFEDIPEVRKSLMNDAKEYIEKKRQCEKDEQRQQANREEVDNILPLFQNLHKNHPDWEEPSIPKLYLCENIVLEWNELSNAHSKYCASLDLYSKQIEEKLQYLEQFYAESGRDEAMLDRIAGRSEELTVALQHLKRVEDTETLQRSLAENAQKKIGETLSAMSLLSVEELPVYDQLAETQESLKQRIFDLQNNCTKIATQLDLFYEAQEKLRKIGIQLDEAKNKYNKWNRLNEIFGGNSFRTLVQSYILRPLLNNANLYLQYITDQYTLTCDEKNEQLSILVYDSYNKQVRSVTVLSGGERFMISLALSLALSSLNRPDMNVNILFIDEGFGTLDEANLNSVMQTLERLQEIAGQSNRRVGIISHREELEERIRVKIRVEKRGQGRSRVSIVNE